MLLNPLPDGDKHFVDLKFDIQVIKTEETETNSFELLLSFGVFLLSHEVTVAVDFNYQS